MQHVPACAQAIGFAALGPARLGGRTPGIGIEMGPVDRRAVLAGTDELVEEQARDACACKAGLVRIDAVGERGLQPFGIDRWQRRTPIPLHSIQFQIVRLGWLAFPLAIHFIVVV